MDSCYGNPAFMWGGLQIVEHPFIPATQPKLKLRPNVPVTEKFRAEMDVWLLEMFGTERVCYVMSGKVLMANCENVAMIKGLAL